MALGSNQPQVKMSTRNIPGGKGSRCVRLTSPSSCAECHEIWEPKPPGTLWATPGLLRDCCTFYLHLPRYLLRSCFSTKTFHSFPFSIRLVLCSVRSIFGFVNLKLSDEEQPQFMNLLIMQFS